jgi:periplasmic divalent cation tolerance protein
MEFKHVVIFITVPSEEVGRVVADTLLKGKLAACVNMISPVNSLYRWQGEIHDDQEVMLVVKSSVDLFEDELVPAVKAVHPYEVPEIIALPIIMGSDDYLTWIDEETK